MKNENDQFTAYLPQEFGKQLREFADRYGYDLTDLFRISAMEFMQSPARRLIEMEVRLRRADWAREQRDGELAKLRDRVVALESAIKGADAASEPHAA